MPPFQVPPPAHRVNRVPLKRGNTVDLPSFSAAHPHRKPKRKASADADELSRSSGKEKERDQAKEAVVDRERSSNPNKKKRQKENRRSRSASLNDGTINFGNDGEPEAVVGAYRPLFSKMDVHDDEMLRRFQAMKAPKVTPSKLRDATFASPGAAKSSPLRPSAPTMRRDQDQRLLHMSRQLTIAKEDAAKKEDALQKRVEELEQEVLRQRGVLQEAEKVNETNDKMKSDLKDAVSCQVCFETLNDPHILSCGHLACRECLTSWFRTPGAYVHEVPDAITPDVDTSYQTKVCHVCRSHITRRPARLYHLGSILEPLGIEAHLPTTSQALRNTVDPWHMLFPPVKENETYKLRDESDQVNRCPECYGEIEDAHCEHCGIEFSDSDVDEDFGSEDGAGFLDEGSEIGDLLDPLNDHAPIPSDEESLDDFLDRIDGPPPRDPRIYNPEARVGAIIPARVNANLHRRHLRFPVAYVDSAAEDSGSEDEDEDGEQSDVDAVSEEEGYEDSLIDDEEEGDGGEEPMKVDVDLTEEDELEDSEDDRARRGIGPNRDGALPVRRPSPVVRRRRGMMTRPIVLGSDSE